MSHRKHRVILDKDFPEKFDDVPDPVKAVKRDLLSNGPILVRIPVESIIPIACECMKMATCHKCSAVRDVSHNHQKRKPRHRTRSKASGN